MARESSAFIGRRAELDRLRAGLLRASHGSPVAVVVSGEAGIGKSRLLDEFADDVARPAGADGDAAAPLVLRGWCVPVAGAGVAFGPVAMLLRDALRQVPELTEVVRERASDIATLLPESVLSGPRPPAPSGELGYLRMIEASRVLLAEAARTRPVVAIVEDVHWADRSSGAALAHLASRSQPGGLMVVVSYRSEDLPRHHHMAPILRELERTGHGEGLAVSAFDGVELRAQLTELLGTEPTEDLVQALAERSGGNPFFVEELVAAESRSPDELPIALSDLLVSRMDPLPAQWQRLVRVAAAVGRRVHPALLARCLGVSEADAVPGIRAAVDAGILKPVADRLEFRHELMREAVYATLLPGERRPLHASVARVLTDHPELSPGEWCMGDLAYHWTEAGVTRAALEASVRAAAEAREYAAPAAAARHTANALELWDSVDDAEELVGFDRIELYIRMSEDSMLGGGVPAHTWASRALELIDCNADPVRYALVAVRSAWLELMAGRAQRALDVSADAARVIAAHPDGLAKAKVDTEHAQILMMCDRYQESAEASRQAHELAVRIGDRNTEVYAGAIYGVALCTVGDWIHGLQVLEEASRKSRTLPAEEGAAGARARAALSYSFCLYWLGFTAQAHRVAEAGSRVAAVDGLGLSMGFMLRSCAAAMAVASGDVASAELLLADVSPSPVQRFSRFLAEARASIAIARGEFRRADEVLAGASVSALAPVGLYHLGPIEVAVAEQRFDDARALIGPLLDDALARDISWKIAPLAALGVAAENQCALHHRIRGDHQAAAEAVERAEELVARAEAASARITALAGDVPPSVRAWEAMARARLADTVGEPDPAAWAYAVECCVLGGFPFLVMQARMSAAGAALAVGDRELASSQVARLLDEASAHGYEPQLVAARELAERARLRTGEKAAPGAQDTAGRVGLTDREVQVLALVAEGMTNKEIGERLFLSPKTVSVHITNLLRKLDVPGRRDAARLARRLGIV